MNNLKQVITFLIDSSVWVATSVLCLTLVTYFHLELELNPYILLLNFFGTILGYNFIKNFNHHTNDKVEKGILKWLSAFSVVVSCYCILNIKMKTTSVLSLAFLFTFFYSGPFVKLNLRSIKGFKIYVISMSWAIVTVLLPFLESTLEINLSLILEFIQRFIFVLILTLPFEIRDLQTDDIGLKTIPQIIGVRKSKLLGCLFLLVFIALELLKTQANVVELIVVSIITALFVIKSSEAQSKFYSCFWVEGIPIYWTLILGIVQLF